MDLSGPHQAAPGEDTEHGPTHLAPARLIVAGPPRSEPVAPASGRGATDAPPAEPPAGIRRRLIFDAAILLGAASALVLAVSFVAPAEPSGGVLGITTSDMATAGTIVGPGPAATTPRSTHSTAAGPATEAPSTIGIAVQVTSANAPAASAAAPGASGGLGPSAASLAELTPCPGREGCYLYVVRRGDNLTRIAVHFGVATSRILAMNPAIVDPSIIVTGTTVRIPTPTR